MDIITLVAIASASAINSAIPGPCIALTVGRSARHGLDAGLSVSVGVLLANLALASLALSVMLGILATSQGAFAAMKWIGAGVMILLAVRMLGNQEANGRRSCVTDGAAIRDLTGGLMVGLSSPFNLVFLLALLPQFVSSDDLNLSAVATILVAVVVGAAVSQVGASFIGAVSGGLMASAARRIECACAVSLIGFALGAAATTVE